VHRTAQIFLFRRRTVRFLDPRSEDWVPRVLSQSFTWQSSFAGSGVAPGQRQAAAGSSRQFGQSIYNVRIATAAARAVSRACCSGSSLSKPQNRVLGFSSHLSIGHANGTGPIVRDPRSKIEVSTPGPRRTHVDHSSIPFHLSTIPVCLTMSPELRSRTTARTVTIARHAPSAACILALKHMIRLRCTELQERNSTDEAACP